MVWELYKDIKISKRNSEIRRRDSVTSDVLSYRRCARQYYYYSENGFVASLPNQIFIGTIIHEVLDRAHGHYSGRRNPKTAGTIPTDEEISKYFEEVENALRTQGMRVPVKVKEYALGILTTFNRIEGPSLYPRVVDTEHRLQSDRGDYILYGVVDVLVSDPNEPNQREIWDYKGTKRPDINKSSGRKILEDYLFQMQVYANLYKLRNNEYPKKAIIYFLGELAGEHDSTPKNAILEVELEEAQIENALREFEKTVDDIEASRENRSWPPPVNGSESASKETCDICDLRWNCPVEMGNYPKRLLI